GVAVRAADRGGLAGAAGEGSACSGRGRSALAQPFAEPRKVVIIGPAIRRPREAGSNPQEDSMERLSTSLPRRTGVTAVHSLHRFVFTVPDLDEAARFYTAFGLDVRRDGQRIDLYTFGHPHRWGSIYRAAGPKKLQYLSFAAYPEDLDPLRRHLDTLGIRTTEPHPLGDEPG